MGAVGGEGGTGVGAVGGEGGGLGDSEWLDRPLPPGRPRRPWTTARTTTTLRQRGPRHCVATSVLRNCCFDCCAELCHKDNVRSTAVEEQLKQK